MTCGQYLTKPEEDRRDIASARVFVMSKLEAFCAKNKELKLKNLKMTMRPGSESASDGMIVVPKAFKTR
jgi:hypothetical protein